MRSRELLAEARTPEGEAITLTRSGGHFVVAVAGVPLMSSAAHHSEERMAEVGCAGLAARRGARVLVAGLGMGYTLRAALDHLAPDAAVVVVELVPALVAWNQGPLGPLAGRPLGDPRVLLEVGDVARFLAAGPEPFDGILLDVDNGPDPVLSPGNAWLYAGRGLARLRNALRPGGTLVVWSAYESPAFPDALRRAGLKTEVVRARSRGHKGGRHTLYVGRRGPKPGPGTP